VRGTGSFMLGDFEGQRAGEVAFEVSAGPLVQESVSRGVDGSES